MSDSLEKSDLLKHRWWSPETTLSSDESILSIARRRALLACVFFFASVAVSGWSAWKLHGIVMTPVPVAGKLPSGWIFGGIQKNFTISQEEQKEIWVQIVEAHFARTEKGGLPGIEEFSTKDTPEHMDRFLKDVSKSRSVRLTVVEARVSSVTASQAVLLVRGRLTVIGDKGRTASSEIYLSPLFEMNVQTEINPTGWRMTGLNGISRDDFYMDEREEARRKLLGLEDEAGK